LLWEELVDTDEIMNHELTSIPQKSAMIVSHRTPPNAQDIFPSATAAAAAAWQQQRRSDFQAEF